MPSKDQLWAAYYALIRLWRNKSKIVNWVNNEQWRQIQEYYRPIIDIVWDDVATQLLNWQWIPDNYKTDTMPDFQLARRSVSTDPYANRNPDVIKSGETIKNAPSSDINSQVNLPNLENSFKTSDNKSRWLSDPIYWSQKTSKRGQPEWRVWEQNSWEELKNTLEWRDNYAERTSHNLRVDNWDILNNLKTSNNFRYIWF